MIKFTRLRHLRVPFHAIERSNSFFFYPRFTYPFFHSPSSKLRIRRISLAEIPRRRYTRTDPLSLTLVIWMPEASTNRYAYQGNLLFLLRFFIFISYACRADREYLQLPHVLWEEIFREMATPFLYLE